MKNLTHGWHQTDCGWIRIKLNLFGLVHVSNWLMSLWRRFCSTATALQRPITSRVLEWLWMLSWRLRCMWSGLHHGASTSSVSCGLFGPRCPLIMPECWLTPSSPVVSITVTASYTRPQPFTFVPFSWCWTLLRVWLPRSGSGKVSPQPCVTTSIGFWLDTV